jgi:hypothetical protein
MLPPETRQYVVTLSPVDAALAISASLSCSPSGTGELNLVSLNLSPPSPIATITVSGGQPEPRCYSLLLLVTRSDGQVVAYEYTLPMGMVPNTNPPQIPPFSGYGTALEWPGFNNTNGFLSLAIPLPVGWDNNSTGLPAGSVYAPGSGSLSYIHVVPGITPNPSAPPVIFGDITASGLLALGGGNLPLADPMVVNQIYNPGGALAISKGI